MLTEHELALIERLKAVGNCEVQEVLIDYMTAKLRESPSPPTPEPTADKTVEWTPKVGDMVVFKLSKDPGRYKITKIEGMECKLELKGAAISGWFYLGYLALAPMPDEPTADEMLDFLESDKRMMHWSVGQGWVVCGFGCGLPYRPTIREAIKLAMEVRK